MSYYLFKGSESLQNAQDRYHNCGGKEKAAKYYTKNKMSGYIKYFDNGGKNMSFMIERTYLKAKVKESHGVLNTSF